MDQAEKQIEELCTHYDVYKYNKKLRIRRGVARCFNELLDSYGQGEIYILNPDTLDSRAFFHILSEKNQMKIPGMMCGEQHDFSKQYLVRRSIGNPVRIIIDTRMSTSGNKDRALQLLNRCRVVNIYDCLRDKGLTFSAEWYRGLGITYHDIYMDYEQYQNSDGIRKDVAIKRLIGDYLAVRDFINAEKWIGSLSTQCGVHETEVEKSQELWNKIQKCLGEIKEKISNKDHIVVNWIDALRFDELCNMDFLYKKCREGIYFEKMYTAAPYTSAVMKTLFTGKHLIDGRLYALESNESYEKSRLSYYLKQHNYKFICNSMKFSELGGMFYNRSLEEYRAFYPKNIYVPSTIIQFDAVCRLAEEKVKCFMLIHNLGETHAPWLNPINGKLENDQMESFDYCSELEAQELMEQIVMSQKYLDTQLEYYGQFYHNVRYNIYLSDHGQGRRENVFALEGLSHIVFAISGKAIQASRKVEDVYSLVLFPRIIKMCLQNCLQKLDTIKKENYALVQFDDVYSKNLAEHLIKMPKNKTILHFLQYRAIITAVDSYIKYAMGAEYYFRNDTCGNLIDEEQYQHRIAYLKKLAGNQYINIEEEKRYEAARGLYYALGYKTSEDIEFIHSKDKAKK